MTAKNLTDAFVRNVKPPKKEDRPNQLSFLHTLERGLAIELIVGYGGTKTFRLITYRNGKSVSRKLGTYPALKVKEARATARDFWQNAESGATRTPIPAQGGQQSGDCGQQVMAA